MDYDKTYRIVKSEPTAYLVGRLFLAFFGMLKHPVSLFLSFEGKSTLDTWKRVIARLVLFPLLSTAFLVSCEFSAFRKDPFIRNPNVNFYNVDLHNGENIIYTEPESPKKIPLERVPPDQTRTYVEPKKGVGSEFYFPTHTPFISKPIDVSVHIPVNTCQHFWRGQYAFISIASPIVFAIGIEGIKYYDQKKMGMLDNAYRDNLVKGLWYSLRGNFDRDYDIRPLWSELDDIADNWRDIEMHILNGMPVKVFFAKVSPRHHGFICTHATKKVQMYE